ncbi:MAG: DNA topoisomerase I, partial [Candidatus Micrarchaeaceae archaeon]
MATLIVSEKPSVALRISQALSSGKAERHGEGKINYYSFESKGESIYVAAAAGHLFTLKQTSRERDYPALDIAWAPSYEVGSKSAHTKAYLDLLISLGKKCEKFINACDFDVEGTVIGTNIIKFIAGENFEKVSKRMKFSTTTTPDLLEAFANLMPMDLGNFYAGEARHMLDWLWGINFSRALTRAAVGRSFSKSLSIGRVQGPALAILAKHEIEIARFVPRTFWRLSAVVNGVEFLSKRGDIYEESIAKEALSTALSSKTSGVVESVERSERSIKPYPPFDLTSLQLEASKVMHYDPSRTLAIAQSLYERSYISYPRTSSQKLPQTLGLSKIIKDLSKNQEYKKYADYLIESGRFKPLEGKKSDEAHPAIFPTGEMPKNLTAEEQKLYDLIARRFLSCFGEDALMSLEKVTISFGGEEFVANGHKTIKKGWREIYTFISEEEKDLPQFTKGAKVSAHAIEKKELQTQPPKRYTKAGLISDLEKRDLGTKATRASIIDTLFKRGYAEGTSIKVTPFGMKVYETLANNCSMIVDENTTRRLEKDMEQISSGKKSESEVIEEGKQMLIEALKTFDKNITKISEDLRSAMRENVTVLGKCPKDGGDLVIRFSRAGKSFAACSNYPKCTNTYSLPQKARIEPTGKVCEYCHTPFIKVFRPGKKPFEMDLDPTCITKKEWGANSSYQTKT